MDVSVDIEVKVGGKRIRVEDGTDSRAIGEDPNMVALHLLQSAVQRIIAAIQAGP